MRERTFKNILKHIFKTSVICYLISYQALKYCSKYYIQPDYFEYYSQEEWSIIKELPFLQKKYNGDKIIYKVYEKVYADGKFNKVQLNNLSA